MNTTNIQAGVLSAQDRTAQTATTACPECSGQTFVLRRAIIRVYLFGEPTTPRFVQAPCPTCKGEGCVPLGTEVPPAPSVDGQEYCRRCGWPFHDDYSEQCDECGVVSRRQF